jgi:hypothetical protein
MDEWNLEYNAHSALYHCIPGLITTRSKTAHQITKVFPDKNGINLEIQNEDRLKEKLFNEIKSMYNSRIRKYGLDGLFQLGEYKDNLEIIKFKLINSSFESDDEDYSGVHRVYPKTFVCSECGDFRSITYKKFKYFDPNKCSNTECNGRYDQMSIVLFCDVCGRIKELREYNCKEHKDAPITLKRIEWDSLGNWEVICPICQKKGKEPVQLFNVLSCNHYENDFNKTSKLCSEPRSKFIPLTIKEGGIFSPIIITSVDIPPVEYIDLKDLEFVLLALHLGKFDDITEDIGEEVSLEDIEELIMSYNSKILKKKHFKQIGQINSSENKKNSIWREYNHIDLIEDVIGNLKDRFNHTELENFNDYFAITKPFSDYQDNKPISYDEHIISMNNEDKKEIALENYEKLKEDFGLEDIKYVPSLTLISSCIGVINGINRFYEEDFVPHFNPLWKDADKKDTLLVYSYPYETEGIIFDLDKIKVCDWLIKNEFIKNNKPKSSNEAKEILLNIQKYTDDQKYTEEFLALKTLLHTLSHILINKASLYTGLDTDSSSEILFVNQASILIFSTSNINIGGFEHIFENSLFNWFYQIKIDMLDCILDPTCIYENGACFSCLYLPEYVCAEFNHFLDRDVFVGKGERYQSYW